MKKSIMVWLEEDDKKMVIEAAYKNRVAVAAWVRSVIVEVAREQTGGAK